MSNRVETNIGSANQMTTRDVSWWPHPKILSRTYLDTACWTWTHEWWFKRRIDKLRSGDLDLLGQNEWRVLLGRKKGARKVEEQNRSQAAGFLKR